MAKALVLLSGGLDSMLAVKVLAEQGIEVTALSFKSCFFNTEKAKKAAEQLGIKLIEIDFSKEHLEMVKKPKYGYGKNMNPCIDCHGMMIGYASKYLRTDFVIPGLTRNPGGNGIKVGSNKPEKNRNQDGFTLDPGSEAGMTEEEVFDFVATGEVLGQRPMSQNRDALKKVEKVAGLLNNVLRPLSAKNLEETEIEKNSMVAREKLLGIEGRSRERQMELAEKLGIKEYSSPGGGCILTDLDFGKRLKKLFLNWPDCDENDVELIKNGRVFWINNKVDKSLIVVGRDAEDNEILAKIARTGDIVVELKEEKGPFTVVRNYKFQIINSKQIQNPKSKIFKSLDLEIPNKLNIENLDLDKDKSQKEILEIAGLLTGYYSTKARGKKVKLEINYI